MRGGDHRIHGEQLVSFAVMGFPLRTDPHPNHVHDLLDQRARIPGRFDPQLRSHQLNEIGA